jgi:hypothetical protein
VPTGNDRTSSQIERRCSILKLKRWATANGHRQEPTHSRHSADLAKSPRPGWVVTPKYTEQADENLRVMDFARRRIDDPDPLARVVHERLFSGDVMLAHHRLQPSFEPAKQVAEPTISVALLVDRPISRALTPPW